MASGKEAKCYECGTPMKLGLECSSCFQEYCLGCLNKYIPDTVSEKLLSYVKELKTFNWDCHRCSDTLLPTQLLLDGKVDHKLLETMGVPKQALTFRIPRMRRSPTPSPQPDKSLLKSLQDDNDTQKKEIEQLRKQLEESRSQVSNLQEPKDDEDEDDDQKYGLFDPPNPLSTAGAIHGTGIRQPLLGTTTSSVFHPRNQVSNGTFQTVRYPVPTVSLGPMSSAIGTVPTIFSSAHPSLTYVSNSSIPGVGRPISSLSTAAPPAGALGYSNSAFGSYPTSTYQQFPLPSSHYGYFPTRPPDPTGYNLPLPTLKLKLFGDPVTDDFDAWLHCFSTNVDQLPIDDVKKWQYLQMSIKENSSAAKKIKGLGQNPANYKKALEILMKNFKDDRQRKPQLWDVLKNLEKVNKSLHNLEDWIDTVRSTSEALLSLGVCIETLDEYANIHLIEKLPQQVMDQIKSTRMVLETLQPGRYSSEMKMNDLLDHLVNILKSNPKARNFGAAAKDDDPSSDHHTTTLVQGHVTPGSKKKKHEKVSPKPKMNPCVFCGGNHWNDKCTNYKTPEERFAVAKTKKLCFNCLKEHRIKDCNKTKKCYYCDKKHNQALCRNKDKKSDDTAAGDKSGKQVQMISKATPSAPAEEEDDIEESKTSVKLASGQKSIKETSDEPVAIMATLPATVVNPTTGEKMGVTVYLDSGSQSTNIISAVTTKLSLPVIDTTTLKTARFGDSQLQDIEANRVKFVLEATNGYQLPITAWSVPTICATLINEPIKLPQAVEDMMHRYQVVNKPPTQIQKMDIHVLIGMDYFNFIMSSPDSSIHCLSGSLRIHETAFGSILSGCSDEPQPISKKQRRRINKSFLAITKRDVKEFFDQETIGIKPDSDKALWDLRSIGIDDEDINSKKDSEVRRFFKSTIRRDAQNRFEVQFPFRPGVTVTDNFKIALKRLQLVINKLCPDPNNLSMIKQYDAIFQDQLKQGMIETVDIAAPGRVTHYLSHFAVFKESSATTKIRVVLDPSAKSGTGLSLNETIYKGDNTLADLTGMLLRFFLPKYALCADIAKAFLQISLHPDSRDCVRFLWLSDVTQPSIKNNLQAYRYTRVPFGVITSPFLLGATIQSLLESCPGEVSSKCMSNCYADNVIISCDSVNECMNIQKEAKELFASGKFDLREWQTNCSELMKMIPEKDKAKGDEIKVLGLNWSVKNDTVHIKSVSVTEKPATKRTILKNIAAVFDPTGKLGPITIQGKIIYQKCCKLGISWDSKSPESIQNEWDSFKPNLEKISTIHFERRVIEDFNTPVELICFSDASENAYCSCIFIRNLNSAMNPKLLFAKTRVSPIKTKLSIPKLETMAIVIGIRALKFVEEQIKLSVYRKIVYTDSQIVLHQLNSTKSDTAWGQRRISEIKSLKEVEFFYVPTNLNCADLATRGISIEEFKESTWVKGIDWLKSTEKPMWPMQKSKMQISCVAVQKGEHEHIKSEGIKNEALPFELDPEKFPNLTKLFSVTFFCHRFIEKLKRKQHSNEIICAEDVSKAKLEWILAVQGQEYNEEIQNLKSGKKNKRISQMDLFLDSDGVIRCGSRFINAAMSYDSKFPILLPKNHSFTNLAIRDAHSSVFHFKTKQTMSKFRTLFWVPAAGEQVKRIITRCNKCQRLEGGSFKPAKFAPFPLERVTQSPPFLYTMLDYAGPMIIRLSHKNEFEKRWVACFTCMSTRAVHLELIHDCSGESAIRAIERFVARRSTPALILSDNASCFLKAAKVINKLWKNSEIDENYAVYFAKAGIRFKFAPERSPFHQGAVERMISLTKKCLRTALFKAVVSEDQLRTWIIKAEGVINQRPITANPADHDDMGILSPAHFLAPLNNLVFPPLIESDDPDFSPNQHEKEDMVELYKKGNRRLEEFEKLFQTSYLQELRQRQTEFKSKKSQVARVPVVGEICMVKEPVKRLHWPLCRVMELFKSRDDDEIRYVSIKLPSGRITRRAVSDLYPLEITSPTSVISCGPSGTPATPPPPPPPNDPPSVDNSIFRHGDTPEAGPAEPRDRRPSPSRGGPMTRARAKALASGTTTLSLIATILVLITFMINPSYGLDTVSGDNSYSTLIPKENAGYMVCSVSTGGRILTIPKRRTCVLPKPKTAKKLNVTLFVPAHDWPNSTAYMCSLIKTEMCSYSDVLNRPIYFPPSTETMAASVQDCIMASKRGVFNNTVLVPEKLPNRFFTNKTLKAETKWWDYNCNHVINFHMEKGHIFSPDGIHISGFQTTDSCSLPEGFCILEHSTVIWKSRSILKYCSFRKKGIYEATVMDKSLSIRSLQVSFHLTDQRAANQISCLPKEALWAIENVYIYFGIHSGHIATELSDKIDSSTAETELTKLQKQLALTTNVDKADPKLNFLLETIVQNWQENFRHEFMQFCLLAQKEMDILRQLIQIDPTRGARAALGRNDISAEFRGDRLFVHLCRTIRVEKIYVNHRHPESGICYSFIPVEFEKRVYFLVPGTKELLTKSPRISCDEIDQSEKSHHDSSPETMEFKDILITPTHFSMDVPIFTSPVLQKERSVYPPISFQSFIVGYQNYERKYEALVEFTSHLSSDAKSFKEIVSGIGVGAGEFASKVILSVGEVGVNAIHETFSGLAQLTSVLISPMYILGISITVAAVIMLIIVGSCYFSSRLRKTIAGINPNIDENEDTIANVIRRQKRQRARRCRGAFRRSSA